MPKISVIIPVYNVEKYLPATLDSLTGQTFDDFEALCVDSGSSDQSLSVLKEYAAKDERIKIIEQNNRGVSAARNAALDRAGGEYIAFLDSDDLMHPQMLETMFRALTETDSDIVYCDISRFNDGEEVSFNTVNLPATDILPGHFEAFVRNEKTNPKATLWNKLYRAELFKDVRLPEEINVAEDFVVMHSLLFKAKKVAHVYAGLMYYRQRAGSLIHRELKEEDINNGINAVRLILERFKNETLAEPVRKKLNYRLMKMLCKDCIVTPYKRFRKDNGYMRFWNTYCGLLSDLKQTGFYQPRYLDLRNQLFSALFLKRRFSALRLLLNWI